MAVVVGWGVEGGCGRFMWEMEVEVCPKFRCTVVAVAQEHWEPVVRKEPSAVTAL